MRLLILFPKRLAPIVMDGGLPSRPAWECALMLKLQEELKCIRLTNRTCHFAAEFAEVGG